MFLFQEKLNSLSIRVQSSSLPRAAPPVEDDSVGPRARRLVHPSTVVTDLEVNGLEGQLL